MWKGGFNLVPMFPGSKVISHPYMRLIQHLYESRKGLLNIKTRREMVLGIVKSCLYVSWINIYISLPLHYQPYIISTNHLGFR